VPGQGPAQIRISHQAQFALTETRQSFVFEDIAAAPVASLLRDFFRAGAA
jgi:hypothetical protein